MCMTHFIKRVITTQICANQRQYCRLDHLNSSLLLALVFNYLDGSLVLIQLISPAFPYCE